jgi:hypothetical protein
MSDPLFEALRASAEAPDARLTARSEAEATAAFLAAHRRVELTASGRTGRTELTASASAPISRIFGALAVAAVVVLYGGWALVAAGGVYR